MLPPLSIIAAAGLANWNAALGMKPWGRIAATKVVAISFFLCAGVNASVYLQPSAGAALMARVYPYHQLRDVHSMAVAEYIAARTGPDDLIFNLGHQGELYFYADRRPASRFFHEFAVMNVESNRRKLLADLERNRPVYIIDTQKTKYLEGNSIKYLEDVAAFIERNYVLEKRIEFDAEWLRIFSTIIKPNHKHSDITYYGDIYRLRDNEAER
jgi:hypothetical protein